MKTRAFPLIMMCRWKESQCQTKNCKNTKKKDNNKRGAQGRPSFHVKNER